MVQYGTLLLCMVSTIIAFTGAQLMPPNMGDNVPKLSMDCYVEFAKYGKPLIDMLMKPNGTATSVVGNQTTPMTTQQKLMGLLASPMGTSRSLFILFMVF